jgi:TonB-linked SusC/RagA family outer membrane protein
MDPKLTYIGAEKSYITESNANDKYYSGNIYADYTKRFKDHDIHLLAGGQLEYNNYFNLYGYRDNLLHPSILSLSAAVGNDIQLKDTQYEWSTEGIFGRINYKYKERYLLEVNARYDGTSRFPKDLRWGFFPSVSAGYIISKEPFFEPVSKAVNMMKFRVSYGRLGNSNVDYYYSAQMSKKQTKLISNGAFVDYMTAPGLGNYDLTWEKPTTFNAAVDVNLFNNQMQTSFDWYSRKTIDMIGPSEPVPAVFGVSVPVKNNTEMKGTGWEWTASFKGNIKNLNYQALVNVGHHKEVVTKYYNPTGLISSYYNGKVLGEIWGFKTVGFINNEQMLSSMPNQSEIYANWGLGDIIYQDLDGDGKISKGSLTLNKHGDLVRIGNTTPDFAYNINLFFDFKGIDLRMFFNGLGHTDWWPNAGQGSANFYTSQIFFGYGNALKIKEHLDRWTPDNHDAYYPRVLISDNTVALKNKQVQTKYLQNRAYLRLKNLQVGYTIPLKVTKPYLISNARLYISGENLLTFTKLRIFDPETPGLIYPLQKVYSAGINVTF